jgi:sodium-dependent dicarboxylate transporter 2/3/5
VASEEEASAGWPGTWGRLLGPVLFLLIWLGPAPEGLSPPAQRLAAVTVLMAVFWATQALPINVTSLVPVVAFPALGIQSASDVSRSYMTDSSFLYLGGFIVALGIEKWGLHRRIALHVISRLGSSPPRIVLGFIVATFGISMWISNTASTLLMLPIAMALLSAVSSTLEEEFGSISSEARQSIDSLGLAVALSIAYAASLGGLTTLVGTPTNIAAAQIWAEQFPDQPRFSAGQWILMWLPYGLMMAGLVWLLLGWRLPTPDEFRKLGTQFFRERLKLLGPSTRGERWMMLVFGVTAILWLSRTGLSFGETTILPGWDRLTVAWLSSLDTDAKRLGDYINDSTVGIAMALAMFAIPVTPRPAGGYDRLMDWKTVERLPWGILLLFGGGFAIAGAFTSTGLSDWVGASVAASWHDLPPWVLLLSVCLLMTFLTEFTTNVATVNAILPILAGIAVTLEIDPRIIMLPAAIAASCAFMLPIGTPPNAIVFGSGQVPMSAMLRTGLVLNIVGAVLLWAWVQFVIIPVWGWN